MMKTENTLENKAKFFAQYWGQHLIIMGSFLRIIDHVTLCNIENDDILQLKPLSKISDEYCILIFNKFFPNAIKYSNAEKIYDIKSSIKSNFSEDVIIDEDFIFYTDFMRSKGYALPYIDLSVEDLIEYGWIKLEE